MKTDNYDNYEIDSIKQLGLSKIDEFNMKEKESYKKFWLDFCNCMEKDNYCVDGHPPRTLEEASGYLETWIERLKQRPGNQPGTTFSVWSIRTYFSSPAKIFGVHANDYNLGKRHRYDIKRSRTSTERDLKFSIYNNEDLIKFCTGTGLRRSELLLVRGTDLVRDADGDYAIKIINGEGKTRTAKIIGSKSDISYIVRMMLDAREEKLWPKVKSAADIQEYRMEYAISYYKKIARPIEHIPKTECYYGRNEKKGITYDKIALQKVADQLGINVKTLLQHDIL